MSIKTTITSEKKRILVVDDKPSDSRLLKLYLEGTNDYVVREENDAKVAISTAEAFKPDLILLDVMMPGMDGGELSACFAAHLTLKVVPIVFLTSIVTKGEVETGRGRIGNYPFLAKPVLLPEVVACIQHHLANAAAQSKRSVNRSTKMKLKGNPSEEGSLSEADIE